MRQRRLGHLLLACLTAAGAAACDGDLTLPTDHSAGDRGEAQPAAAGSGSISQAAGGGEFRDRSIGAAPGLEGFEDAVAMLQPGQCLLEYGRANGQWLRFIRTVLDAGSGSPVPFAVDYRLPGRRVVYRGTCNVAQADRDSAMAAISWAPGNGALAAGKGWRNAAPTSPASVPLPSVVTAATAFIAGNSVDDPLAGYYHYDWCYVVMEGDEIVEVLYCGYDSEPCEEELDGPSGECVIPGETGGTGSGPGDCNPSEEICPEPELVIECDNTTIVRGTSISCTASVTEGGSLSDLAWSFAYEGGTLSVGSSNPLGGTMAVSGTLQATATIDGGPPDTASVSIAVTNRDWAVEKWPFSVVPKGSQGMPASPTQFGELGWFYAEHNALPNAGGTMHTIESGPNAGIAYLTAMPELDVKGNVHVNYAALSPPSAFLDLQTGSPYCTASQVTALIPAIEAHEGLGLEEGSHSRAFRDKMWELGGATMEGVVGAGMAFVNTLKQKFDEVMGAADASKALIDQTNRVPVFCNINYFPG